MIQCPPELGKFQFVVLAKLRAAQLLRGCRPRVEGVHKATVIAQLEVAAGKVTQALVTTAVEVSATISPPVEDLAVMVP
jgi:DNA-directed RNA polymerase subunit K/omega